MTDCTVHPDTAKRSFADPRFMSITVQSVIEKSEQVIGCKLSREYKIPRLKFKGTPEFPDAPCVTVRAASECTTFSSLHSARPSEA